MRKNFLLFIFTISTNILVAQNRLSIDSVRNHLGDSVTVCSAVFGVKATENITFINLGAAYPNSPLTLVIRAKDLVNFTSTPSSLYENKKVCATGILKEYKGKVEIEITRPEEIIVQ